MTHKNKDAETLGKARHGIKSGNTHKAAEKLGSKGGKVGGKARAEKLPASKRESIASKAANARWDKK